MEAYRAGKNYYNRASLLCKGIRIRHWKGIVVMYNIEMMIIIIKHFSRSLVPMYEMKGFYDTHIIVMQ